MKERGRTYLDVEKLLKEWCYSEEIQLESEENKVYKGRMVLDGREKLRFKLSDNGIDVILSTYAGDGDNYLGEALVEAVDSAVSYDQNNEFKKEVLTNYRSEISSKEWRFAFVHGWSCRERDEFYRIIEPVWKIRTLEEAMNF